jgi:hypothetical protein
MWQAEPDEVRSTFKQLAEDEKKRHLELHPGYRYQPRKRTDRKRKKAEGMASHQNDTASVQGRDNLSHVAKIHNPTAGSRQADIFDSTPDAAARPADYYTIGYFDETSANVGMPADGFNFAPHAYHPRNDWEESNDGLQQPIKYEWQHFSN